ncbi:SWIM zinc finger family protein [Brevibacterium atlanticum]|uniref:SWIM zinc finger family protein n=1 Tax=Brevibacterium atlanticum TaxID=2697563 RepID=UPI00141EF5C4|nr:SWIM zinc finger family protein [Brevibacterium atlanticum]
MAGVEFGMTLWGRAWLRVVEPISAAPNPKLPNARRLARSLDDDLRIEPGRITAAFDADRVEVEVPLWTDAERAVIDRMVSSSEAPASAGDLPDELVGELKSAGVEVACALERLQTTCSCRSRAENCVHVLAAIYAAVLLIDQQPTRAVDLRSPRRQRVEALIDPDWIALGDVDADHFYALPR